MFAAYWNLKANPFLNLEDLRYLYSVDQHAEAVARFSYLAEQGRTGGILCGPSGVGKSILLRHIATTVASRHRLPLIHMDAIPDGHLPLARHIQLHMNIEGPTDTMADTLINFRHAIECAPDTLNRTLLCLDEAHHLSDPEGLHLIQYLSNLRIPDRRSQGPSPLFTMILVGTADFLQAVQAWPSLAQRMHMVVRLKPLSRQHAIAYIQQHMRAVGGDLWVFDHAALDVIYRVSEGLPRKINLLCDISLMLGFAAKAEQITESIVEQAVRDSGLTLPAAKEDV